LLGEDFAQVRQEHHLGHVRHRGAKDARTGGRVEALGVAQCILHCLQGAIDGLGQLQRGGVGCMPSLVRMKSGSSKIWRSRPSA
jgi:hypothetical protein